MTKQRFKVEKTRIGSFQFELEYFANFDQVVDDFFDEVCTQGGDEKYWPVFGNLWPASLGLSQFLATLGDSLEQAKVLELGCGLALPSMVARRLGAKVTASDFHPEVRDLLLRNLQRNGIDGIAFENIDWCRGDHYGNFDCIMASDILYDPAPPLELIQFLKTHLKPQGSIYIADIGRVYYGRFLEMMQQNGFRLHSCDQTIMESGKVQKVHIAHFTKA